MSVATAGASCSWAAVRAGFAAGDLDHQHLAAHDPVADDPEERRYRQRGGTISLYSIGTIAAGLTLYLGLGSYYPYYPVVLPIFGFFVFGTFSGFAIYLPELFPTHVRSTEVGFTTGSARVITSFGPLVAGLMVGAFGGSFNNVTAFMTCMAVFSLIAMAMGRETKGAGLPH
jgi:MFS family permease